MPKRSEPPSFIPPQLSQLAKTPPAGESRAHELKYDGYPIHARITGREVKLLTRTGLDWTDRYQTTAKALSTIRARGVAYIDGELCAIRPDGTTSFAELHAATDARTTQHLVYFVFDLLFVNGKDIRSAPLLDRKERLRALLAKLLNRSDTARTTSATAGACWILEPRLADTCSSLSACQHAKSASNHARGAGWFASGLRNGA